MKELFRDIMTMAVIIFLLWVLVILARFAYS